MRTSAALLLSALLIPTLPAVAQENQESAVYKVEFNIRDGSDAGAAGRRYTMLIDPNSKGTFRAGNKVPYLTTPPAPGQAAQYNYADIGVNIDARLQERSGKVYLSADLDVSSVLQQDKGTVPNPTIASIRVSVNTRMIAGKPVLVASVDDPVTKRKFDVEATVTKIN
jgi:hypothetical protein